MNLTILRDRYVGCLVGLAVGDALGAPLEFMARPEIAATFGEVRDFIGGGWLNVEPGEYTDDTQLAIAVAETLLECGQVCPERVVSRLVDWLNTGPKDVGQITRTAIGYHAQRLPWQEIGPRVQEEFPGMSAGNGCIVRAVPVGLFRLNDPAALVQESLTLASLTHTNPLSVWSVVAVNLAIVELLHDRSADLHARVAAMIPEKEVAKTIRTAPTLTRRTVRSGGYVLDTLGAAFWALTQGSTFEDVLVAAVNLGDDADTVGAIAGALAGARDGGKAIPRSWLSQLRHGEILTELARALYRLAHKRRTDTGKPATA